MGEGGAKGRAVSIAGVCQYHACDNLLLQRLPDLLYSNLRFGLKLNPFRDPGLLAARLFAQDHVAEVRMHHDRAGLLVGTRDPERFYELLGKMVLEGAIHLESVAPADEDVHSVYEYLIGAGGGAA